ncbi:zinc-dependent alcohol dehydrogenase family protein [Tahibacter caeni]|uniref:zinc-dependent alcohol dehydrogenase family protein n=1 Tax=Tahibacter caeni TaxID=1453545 RepID=UPI002147FBCD|nr:zinc-dependent alcohol dehydrogenase family protein [Tahibacter caeni]
MRAYVFDGPGRPLQARELPLPQPGPGQIRLRVAACGVCRTDLHLVDGELPQPRPNVVPGHEIVGYVDALGTGVERFASRQRLGVPWLHGTCGSCTYCRRGQENLCPGARFTGYTADGGFAEYVLADARYCFELPQVYDDAAAAPLLCAGLIGFRALRMAGDARRIGLYGLGAAAHLLAQLCLQQGREVYAFVRPGDEAALAFGRRLGLTWCGYSTEAPPASLDAALIFAPAGELVPLALRAVDRGGTVVCGGIHMSTIPAFDYALLWGERQLRSVANLTRADGEEYFRTLQRYRVTPTVTSYPLEQANRALQDLREGCLSGAAVLLTPTSGSLTPPG